MASTCSEIESRLQALFSAEVTDGEFKTLLAHSAECRQCRTLVLLHFHLSVPEIARPQASEDEATWMRHTVLAAMEASPDAAGTGGTGAGQSRAGWLRHAAALLAGALGLVAGWVLFGSADAGILQQVTTAAAGHQRLADSTESPFVISNVSLKEVNGHSVTVDFDVTTHLEVTRPRTDPLVQEVLVQALLSASSAGQSLEAIRFSEQLQQSRVQEALIFAARFDSNPGVRLRALQAVMQREDDPAVRRACLEILASEESVQMRLLAVDYLAGTPDGSRLLREFVNRDDSPASAPVRLRAAHYLQ